MYSEMVNRFSATRPGSWLVKHFAAHVDPHIFRWTNGRFTSTGAPTLPMLTLTVPGRKTGEPRSVQLAYHRDGDDYLVVASAMGAEHHPAWRYNLEAAGGGTIQLRGQQLDVTATVLTDDEKAAVWDQIATTIPQMHTYVQRTDRNIRVFRLTPVTPD
jgi:deazaflavin-dependent oxidoreductase (nitroreductase family)